MLLPPTDHLPAEDKHHHQQEYPGYKHNNSYTLGQPDVPRGGHVVVGSGILTVFPSVLLAAVTVIGAMCVLAKGPVPTGVPGTLINVTLTSAKKKERPLQ